MNSDGHLIDIEIDFEENTSKTCLKNIYLYVRNEWNRRRCTNIILLYNLNLF